MQKEEWIFELETSVPNLFTEDFLLLVNIVELLTDLRILVTLASV